MNPWLIVGGVVAGLILAIMMVFASLQWMETIGQKQLAKRYPHEQPLLFAYSTNCFGQESLGRFQVRGNGVLAITATELWFKAFLFGLDITIPMQMIQSTELVNSFLGKMIYKRKLLKVNFINNNGIQDSIAFLLKDPVYWQNRIEKIKWDS